MPCKVSSSDKTSSGKEEVLSYPKVGRSSAKRVSSRAGTRYETKKGSGSEKFGGAG